MFVFREIWRALFSWNTSFEIRPFALLPTNFAKRNLQDLLNLEFILENLWNLSWEILLRIGR